MKSIILKSSFILLISFLTSCESVRVGGEVGRPAPEPVTKKGGPPAHAPAHGYRKKFQYKYYPDKKVYYCSKRRVYFWIAGDGWKIGTSLPSNLSLGSSSSITVDLDDETPYLHHESNYGSAHPGKGKGKSKGKKKGKYK